MQTQSTRPISGHVYKLPRKSGPVWFAKYRLPDGRQVQKRIGPHWPDKSAPEPGWFTKRTAKAWLDDLLAKARRNELPGMIRTDTTFAAACDAWLAHKRTRALKVSTLTDYQHTTSRIKSVMADVVGDQAKVETITTADVEAFRDKLMAGGSSDRTVNKYLAQLHDLFDWAKRPYGLIQNPAAKADVERRPHDKGNRLERFTREQVTALADAAENDQDRVLYLTAAFTGLRRGELLALRWGDVSFADASIRVQRSYRNGILDTPKSGKERTAVMFGEAAEALEAHQERSAFSGDEDLVFAGERGGHLNEKKLTTRFKAAMEEAGLPYGRPDGLVFHDLRATFGSLAIRELDALELMQYMGHASITTTQRYLRFVPRQDVAQRLAKAFAEN